VLWLLLAGLLWGTGGLTGTLLGRAAGLPALSVAAWRLTAGGALIVIVLTAARQPLPQGRAAWRRIAGIGVLAAQFQGCYFGAVRLTSLSLATLITIGSAPVLVQAGTALLRRPGRARPAVTVLALGGLTLLVGVPGGGPGSGRLLAGAGLSVLAAAGFATMTLLCAEPAAGLAELTATGYGFLLGGGLLMPLAALTGGVGFTPRPASAGLLLALGTGPTAIAYTLYFRGLRHAPAATAVLFSLIEPLTATVLAVLLLGNRLSAAGVAGAALLALSVVLTATGSRAPG
jgi:DME family drug/metabolite transporter